MQDNLPRSIVHFRYMIYLLVIWWILGLLPDFPAWAHRWARILPGPSVAASGCQGSGRDSSTAVLCQTPNEAPQNLYSFPRFRRSLIFQTWDFNWCLRSVFPPFRANQSKNRGYLNVHVWIHAAGGECCGCFNPRPMDLGRVFDVAHGFLSILDIRLKKPCHHCP